ncbi:hypothetical protein JTE90_007468 [Oedothorax gibbosus]|uniref:Uncharacterized protein n=1 Tax=Oedothorax gibbosus TaxID=931172 RepID=A0AAV6U9K6_9ARAC|nr:hypothetical protein JTE90_007468 [Oedothorax gibbosus]
MDALKAKRKSLRTSFTTCENKLKQYLCSIGDKDVVQELYALKSQFKDKFNRLDEVQNEISSLLLEDPSTIGEYETDFHAAEVYRDNYLDLDSRVEAFLNKDVKSCSRASLEGSPLKVRLPKVELKTFSGDPKDYLTFWSIFSKIHESDELSEIDKFQYLYQSMVPGSKAS